MRFKAVFSFFSITDKQIAGEKVLQNYMNALLRIAWMSRKKEQKTRQQQRSTHVLTNSIRDENQPFLPSQRKSEREKRRKNQHNWTALHTTLIVIGHS